MKDMKPLGPLYVDGSPEEIQRAERLAELPKPPPVSNDHVAEGCEQFSTRPPIEDIQMIRDVAGDLEVGYFQRLGDKQLMMRGNIGGIVTRACDRLEAEFKTLAKASHPSPDIEKLISELEAAKSHSGYPSAHNRALSQAIAIIRKHFAVGELETVIAIGDAALKAPASPQKLVDEMIKIAERKHFGEGV